MMRLHAFFLFAFFALHAAPVGNPAAPHILKEGVFIPYHSGVYGRVGYEGDFVQDARMKQIEESSGIVDRYTQTSNGAALTLNVVDRLDLYGLLSSSSTSTNWRYTNDSDYVVRIKLETPYHFLWGLGARAILFEWGNLTLGTGGRYEQTGTRLSSLTSDGIGESVQGTRFHWREWQVDLGLSYHIDILTPYIGTKYSSARTEVVHAHVPIAANGSSTTHFENRHVVGLIVGCSLSTGKYFMLNVEGRLFDEEAVSVSADIRF